MIDLTGLTFGQKIRCCRKYENLTLQALAARAGMSPLGVWRLEHDQSRPRNDSARRLAEALGVPVERLTDGVEMAPRPTGRTRTNPVVDRGTRPPSTGLRGAIVDLLNLRGALTTEECWAQLSDMGVQAAGFPVTHPRVATEMWQMEKRGQIQRLWRGCYDAIREPAPEQTAENSP